MSRLVDLRGSVPPPNYADRLRRLDLVRSRFNEEVQLLQASFTVAAAMVVSDAQWNEILARTENLVRQTKG